MARDRRVRAVMGPQRRLTDAYLERHWNALAAALTALESLGEEEPARLRHAVTEQPAAPAHGSGPTLTSIFPMFSPASRPIKAAGAFSIPSTTVSR